MKKENEKKLYYQVKKSVDLSRLPKIEGYNFDEKFDFEKFASSFNTTGLQASELGKAIEITRTMVREDVPIFLSFTSNMVSSGVRESIKYLVKTNKIKVLVTAGGGIEEDAIKARSPFRVGNFEVKGEALFDSGVSRIGNIFTTNEHYTYFEFFIRQVFDRLMEENTKDGYCIVSPSEIANMIGRVMEKDKEYDFESSILYWAYKNNIPVFCPGIIDGAIGDMLYFYKKTHKNFVIDSAKDHEKIIDYTLNCEKTAAIILGGGIAKHYTLNANIFKEGLDYAVYISTAQSFDGSDSGGNTEEAISWAKIKTNAPTAKVNCDASIAFPLLVAAGFLKK
jgi:deoxyhypusine synthase